jgi:hypothetical protein
MAAGDNPERLHSEAAWAHLCGVAPVPKGSGKTNGKVKAHDGYAKWIEARNLYEAFGFKFTRSAPGTFGRQTFYELLI